VPSIVSHHDDLPFVAAPNGSLVLGSEVDQWAQALRSLYEDEAALTRMSAAARVFARKYHSPATNAAARLSIYTGNLSPPHDPTPDLGGPEDDTAFTASPS
jgi:hypothetical protein